MANDTKAKYHHLVPQTYLSAWANESGTLSIEFLDNPGIVIDRNKVKIAGITDYYSIKAGMPICTQKDTDLIFSSVTPYEVTYDGKVLSNSQEMNRFYWDFEKWTVKRKDGSLVSKKRIRSDIEKVKIRDIEENWSHKYENQWTQQVKTIEETILVTSDRSVREFDKEFLMRFFVALDWRGFCSNALFENSLNGLLQGLEPLQISKEERVLPVLENAKDEMRHYLLLQYFRDYLNDSGVIFQYVIESLKRTTFHFFVSDGPTTFITSDTPAFIDAINNEKLAGLLPITPRILMVQGLDGQHTKRYYISHITEAAVRKYNTIIRNNAEAFIVHYKSINPSCV